MALGNKSGNQVGSIHEKPKGRKSRETIPLKVEFLGEFEFIFETALDHASEDQLGTSGEITLDRKISRYCPIKITASWCIILFLNLKKHLGSRRQLNHPR